MSNVIQFPGKKPDAPKAPAAPKTQAPSNSKKTLAASVLSIALFTVAVNGFTFSNKAGQSDMASAGSGRGIASVNKLGADRDARWERQLAERLASPQARDLASASIGRAATMEEKLRWGILEEKYTITYKPEEKGIRQILLQDPTTNPAYILDRNGFLAEYGPLFEKNFESAKLTSKEMVDDKTVETYTLYGHEGQPKGEARFELDRHKRLLSLKVEPVQI